MLASGREADTGVTVAGFDEAGVGAKDSSRYGGFTEVAAPTGDRYGQSSTHHRRRFMLFIVPYRPVQCVILASKDRLTHLQKAPAVLIETAG